ncbi:hypothetical protein LTR08_001513 [Meristemomyces frigidus]|nr:hypothetical protein LTR08_001513 [Meristemomyces frigidus]
MYGLASDGGPCNVLPDSNSTESNPWSWNQYVNMLYIDQPNTVGFSYSTLVNSTLSLLDLGSEITDTGITACEAYNGSVPAANTTFLYGTLPGQDFDHTPNSTSLAGRTLWYFSQAWFSAFPEWKTCNKNISVWGNSYAGSWVPATAAYMQKQNVRIRAAGVEGLVGLTPQMAYNNTYGLEVINKTIYETAVHDWDKAGGCSDQMEQCSTELGARYDPEQFAVNTAVNDVCVAALLYCGTDVIGPFDIYGDRNDFDIRQTKPAPFPFNWVVGFFNQHWVQEALGTPVNFTADSTAVNNHLFDIGGDPISYAGLIDLEYLLESGVKVALAYRDANYRFSAFQPETSFRIFNRAISDKDVATGELPTNGPGNYSTEGPQSSFHIKNELPEPPPISCYLWYVEQSCSVDQSLALANGTAEIVDFTVVEPAGGGGPLDFATGF